MNGPNFNYTFNAINNNNTLNYSNPLFGRDYIRNDEF